MLCSTQFQCCLKKILDFEKFLTVILSRSFFISKNFFPLTSIFISNMYLLSLNHLCYDEF